MRRHQQQLYRGREDQADAHRDRRWHSKKEDQHRHSDGARAHACNGDKERDEQTEKVGHKCSCTTVAVSRYESRILLSCRPSGPSGDRSDPREVKCTARSRSTNSPGHKAAEVESIADCTRTKRRAWANLREERASESLYPPAARTEQTLPAPYGSWLVRGVSQ